MEPGTSAPALIANIEIMIPGQIVRWRGTPDIRSGGWLKPALEWLREGHYFDHHLSEQHAKSPEFDFGHGAAWARKTCSHLK